MRRRIRQSLGSNPFKFPARKNPSPRIPPKLRITQPKQIRFIPSTFDIPHPTIDRKSTRLNSSHLGTSYAVFCLKKELTTLMDSSSGRCSRIHRGRSESHGVV